MACGCLCEYSTPPITSIRAMSALIPPTRASGNSSLLTIDFSAAASTLSSDRDLSTLRNRPVWQAMPEEVKLNLVQPLPIEGQGPEAADEEFLQNVQPYPNGNIHPRFWGSLRTLYQRW